MWLASRPAEELAPWLGRSGQEAIVEGIEVEQRLHIITGTGPALIAEVLIGLGLVEGVSRAFAQCEPVPPVGGRPGVLTAYGNRRDAGVLQLLHHGLELIPGLRSFSNTGLLEQILGIPDAAGKH